MEGLSQHILKASSWEPLQIGDLVLEGGSHELLTIEGTDRGVRFKNKSSEKARFRIPLIFTSPQEEQAHLEIHMNGRAIKGTGALLLGKVAVPLSGKANIPYNKATKLYITFEAGAESEILIQDVACEWHLESESEFDLLENCNQNVEVLVVTPDYPSSANLYLCAFAHSRNRKYIDGGLNVQVASLTPGRKSQLEYTLDGVPVYVGETNDLKRLLSRKQYKVVVVHFVDTPHYAIFDGYITNEQLIFICHGPETSFPCLPNVSRPYFVKPIEDPSNNPEKLRCVQNYATKENVHWVFVSQWLADASEDLMHAKFRNKHCIPNLVDEDLFPYKEKTPDDRKKIMMLRRFDNFRYHSADIAVECILELSRRPFFNDLQFHIVGDGWLFDHLTAPLKPFSNVKLDRTFVPNNKISELHAENGILLIPSRHDSQGVSMCEGASSGLVPVGSSVTTLPFIMEDEINHILSSPEDPCALADTIERLYYNPEEYLAISKRLSSRMRDLFGTKSTVAKEVSLINDLLIKSRTTWNDLPKVDKPQERPILTIVVPSYNIEDYLERCLYTLINHRNAHKTEILVVNDGSSDSTYDIAVRFQNETNGIVRAIDKENGGHGSTINRGIEEARGAYFRVIDGDDWVVSENLAEEVDLLENETADVILTRGMHDYAKLLFPTSIIDYDTLDEGRLYKFDDLTYPFYGFETYGPVLSSSTYRTSCLKNAGFKLSEKMPYIDMEFNAFSLRYIDTLKYFDLDIYRYFIGREGQSVSRAAWAKHHDNHRKVIFNILRTLDKWEGYPDAKKKFVYEHIIAPMIDTQIFMYDQLCLWDNISKFLQELNEFGQAKKAGLAYVKRRNAESAAILKLYENKGLRKDQEPIIKPNGTPRTKDGFGKTLRKALRAIAPYGLIKHRQNARKKRQKAAKAERQNWQLPV